MNNTHSIQDDAATAQALDRVLAIIDRDPTLTSFTKDLNREDLDQAVTAADLDPDHITADHVRAVLMSAQHSPGDVLELEDRNGWWVVIDRDGTAVRMVMRTISTAGGPHGRDVLQAKLCRVPDGARPSPLLTSGGLRYALRAVLLDMFTRRHTYASDSDPVAAQLAVAVLAARNAGAALHG